jgi:hypothetical protein
MRHSVANVDSAKTRFSDPGAAPGRGCRPAQKRSRASKRFSKTLAGLLFRSNAKCARAIWGDLSRPAIMSPN